MADDDIFDNLNHLYQLWWRWGAHFELYFLDPEFPYQSPPMIIAPELIDENEDIYEYVYPIHDFGNKLVTSKAEDMFTAGMSMCKLYYTIEKMVAILIERLQSTGIDEETEVKVAFAGHPMAQRKGFEAIINLPHNVIITNYDPEEWGEQYMKNVEQIAKAGYGYPSRAPRDNFHQKPGNKIKPG